MVSAVAVSFLILMFPAENIMKTIEISSFFD